MAQTSSSTTRNALPKLINQQTQQQPPSMTKVPKYQTLVPRSQQQQRQQQRQSSDMHIADNIAFPEPVSPIGTTQRYSAQSFRGPQATDSVRRQSTPLYRQTSYRRSNASPFNQFRRSSEHVEGVQLSVPQASRPRRGDKLRVITEGSVSVNLDFSTPTSPVSVLSPSPYTGTHLRHHGSPTSTHTNTDHGLGWEESEPYVARPGAAGVDFRESTRVPSYRMSPLSERGVSIVSQHSLFNLDLSRSQSPIVKKTRDHGRSIAPDSPLAREAEARGSLTSLPDLIRRATRLASNLDRGKTASRLGLDVILGSEKSAHRHKDSAYSDMLFAFPAPSSNMAPSRRGDTPITIWPKEEGGDPRPASKAPRRRDESRNVERRCCGLSTPMFLTVMIVLTLLVAGAILIPIFLILVPRQRAVDAAGIGDCPSTKPCDNEGISVIDGNACSCVCVNGYTGHQCAIAADPSCVVADIDDGDRAYPNATLGSELRSLPAISQEQFNIRLNSTTLLSLFAQHDFSCSAENALVDFPINQTSSRRSFVPTGQEHRPRLRWSPVTTDRPLPDDHETDLTLSTQATVVTTDDTDQVAAASKKPFVIPGGPVARDNQPTKAESTAASATATATTSSSSMAPSQHITRTQLDFGGVVVLYVLQKSRSPAVAVAAQQSLEQFFRAGGISENRTTVDMDVSADSKITARFSDFSIIESDGSVIGGK